MAKIPTWTLGPSFGLGPYFSDGTLIPDPPPWEEQEWCDTATCEHDDCQGLLALLYSGD